MAEGGSFPTLGMCSAPYMDEMEDDIDAELNNESVLSKGEHLQV